MSRLLALLGGLAALFVAWGTGLPGLARDLFLAHMAMHMLVIAIAPPLLAIGIGPAGERAMLVLPVLFSPLIASLIELAVVWAWHAPLLHAAARSATAWLVIEQASFLAAGLLVWMSALTPAAREFRGAGILALLMTSVHMTLLGALIALAPRPVYRTHRLGVAEAVLGLDALGDQQLGGALMLVVGGAAYLAGGLVVLGGVLKLPGDPPGGRPAAGRRA